MPHDPPMTRVTVLISGNGSNLQALIGASTTTMPYIEIVRVFSNRANAYGLTRAQKFSIPTTYHNLIAGKYHPSGEKDPEVIKAARMKYDSDLAKMVLADAPDLVICSGWMHILAPTFLDALAAENVPTINLHPGLPGKYDGAGAIKRAYDDYHKGKLEHNRTGIMVHYVISEVDRGEPIVVREVECRTPETLQGLENRIHELEHVLIVEGAGLAISKLWQERNRKSS